ncbi:hypothetical protein MY4038_010094 [Beauveria bassiana]|uniref:Uncharacterized protein n=1 Tax=Beauveria bassiana TaxID=176275 RepID=A0A2N6NWJ9_BEABA|nr:hypothetical protein BM221_001733 [Beauveria bassiana]
MRVVAGCREAKMLPGAITDVSYRDSASRSSAAVVGPPPLISYGKMCLLNVPFLFQAPRFPTT